MEIKNKYNIGDLVYILNNNTVVCLSISFIRIDINNCGKIIIKYGLDGSREWYTEDKIFSTKEELLKSL